MSSSSSSSASPRRSTTTTNNNNNNVGPPPPPPPPPPPGMLPIDNDSSNQEEEEIISLGLQRHLNSILKSPTPSPHTTTANNNNNNTTNAATSTIMIGANRKSAYPATPAAMIRHANNNNGGGNSSNNNNNNLRRTPGPPSATKTLNDQQQHSSLMMHHHHRRTPGAGALQQTQSTKSQHNNNNNNNATSSATSNFAAETPQKLHHSQHHHALQTPSSVKQPQQASSSSSSSAGNNNLSTPQVVHNPTNNNNNSNINSHYNTTTPAQPTTNNNNNNNNNQARGGGGGGRQLYTPAHFTLSKNPDLHIGRFTALSPNTLQLTNSIDNLLDDDYEGDATTGGSVGGGSVGGSVGSGSMGGGGSVGGGAMKEPHLSSHGSKQQRLRGRGGTPITTNKSMSKNIDDGNVIVDSTTTTSSSSLDNNKGGSGGRNKDENNIKPTEFRRIQSQREESDGTAFDSDDESMDELNFQNSVHDDEYDDDDDDDDIDNAIDDTIIVGGTEEENASILSDGSTIASTIASSGGVGSSVVVGVIESPQKSIAKEQQPIRPTPKHSRRQGGAAGGAGSSQPQQHQQQQARHPHHRQQQQQQQRGRQQQQQQQHQSQQHQYPHQQQQGYFHPPHNYQYLPYGGGGSQHHHHHAPSLHGVSPLTLPMDYGGHHYPSNNNPGYAAPPPPISTNNSSVGAASSTHGSWSPIPEFNVNTSEWHPPGSQQHVGGGAGTWGGGGGGGASSYHPPHPHQNYHHHQGMGAIPGHASPEFGFHAIPGPPAVAGHVSPDMFGGGDLRTLSPFMPNFGYPPPPQPQQPQQPQPHHLPPQQQQQQHHGSYAPPPPSQQEQPEQQDHHHSHPTSPIKKGSPNERHRKDTASSVGSAFSGSAAAAAAAASASANNPTSPQSSVLKQTRPGLNLAPSDEGHQGGGWYNNNQNHYSPSGRSMAPPSQLAYQERYEHLSPQHQQGGRGERRGSNSNGQDAGSLGLFQSASSSPTRISSLAAMGDRQLKQGLSNDGNVNDVKKYMHPNTSLGAASQDARNHPGLNMHRGNNNARPPSKSAFQGGNVVGGEDEKQFFMESPSERQAFKEFGRNFRQREAESLSAARDYALASITKDSPGMYLPPSTHWRVYLELADLAKRSNEIDASRQYYRRACQIQSNASQCWLEYSKLEEESGNLKRCADILEEGLKHCSTNENLLVRALKFYERTGHLDHSRQLLARLKDSSIEKSWKTILEGAQMEARAGRYSIAREWLKYLTHHVPWYGPLYKIHSEFERDYGDPVEAFVIVEKGLKELPRYGPLYLVAFRLLEKDDLSRKAYDLPKTMEMVSRADNISRELLWRVHFEAAQSQERAAVLLMAEKPKLSLKKALYATRRSYSKAIMLSPPNLVWKIWLASGRTEVSCGNTNGARDLFLRAYDCVTEKGRSTVLLECARLEEFCGDLALSRSILCKARNEHGKSDWKVWLSSVNLECRCGRRERAIEFAQDALDIHRGTGRLWAALIQLRHEDGEMSQMKVLKLALKSVPKSGEVWCEGARISLNPFCPTFDLQAASRHLVFAARFTPQYGDSFLEQLRLDMIGTWLVPLAEPFISNMYDTFLKSKKMGREEAYQLIAECTKKAADVMKAQLKRKPNSIVKDVVDTSELELHCCSANPNYGHLWFQCRVSPIDSAREVIAEAKDVMTSDIINYSYAYVAAMVRRAGVIMIMLHPDIVEGNGTDDIYSDDFDLDKNVDKQLRLAPTLDVILSEKEVSGSMFVTGLTESNKRWNAYSLAEKRRILFGSDSLVN